MHQGEWQVIRQGRKIQILTQQSPWHCGRRPLLDGGKRTSAVHTFLMTEKASLSLELSLKFSVGTRQWGESQHTGPISRWARSRCLMSVDSQVYTFKLLFITPPSADSCPWPPLGFRVCTQVGKYILRRMNVRRGPDSPEKWAHGHLARESQGL